MSQQKRFRVITETGVVSHIVGQLTQSCGVAQLNRSCRGAQESGQILAVPGMSVHSAIWILVQWMPMNEEQWRPSAGFRLTGSVAQARTAARVQTDDFQFASKHDFR